MKRSQAARAISETAPVFAALGDDVRLRLVTRLAGEGPLSIARLTEGEDVTRQAVTKHLHVLARAGLVESARDGRENVWRLEPRRLGDAQRHLDAISKRWDEALERLRLFVEEEP